MNEKLKEILYCIACYLLPLATCILLLKYGVKAENIKLIVFLSLLPVINISVAGTIVLINLLFIFGNIFINLVEFIK